MPWNRLPDVEACCGCVSDLKAAAAIIAVLGIVASPAVSWAAVRHAYVIRVSCLITTNQDRPDIVDVNLNHILSFGFGSNAGLGPTCLSPNSNKTNENPANPGFMFRASNDENPKFIKAVQIMGWIVLVIDLVFVVCCILFLVHIFHNPDQRIAKVFIIVAIISMLLSLVYSMIFVAACVTMGGAFPIFEFLFGIFDFLIWVYFLVVVNSYRRRINAS